MHQAMVRKIQLALIGHGFVPGEADGVWGRRTIAAVKAFQESRGLRVDGIAGPRTCAALFGAATSTTTPLLPWLAEAEHLIGTAEICGAGSNPAILDWAADLDVRYAEDDIPWCGLFVAHCIGVTLPEEILPANPLGARQWERFGDPAEPRLGAVLVFWRQSRDCGKGHVGFYTGEDDDAYRVLGGNQNNKVCLTWLGKNRFLKARWPRCAASLGGGDAIVRLDRKQKLSANEA